MQNAKLSYIPAIVALDALGVVSPFPFGIGELPFKPLAAGPAGDERKNKGEEVGMFPGCGVNREGPSSLCGCDASESSC